MASPPNRADPAPADSLPASILPDLEKDIWQLAFEEFKSRDEAMAERYKDHIDTFLVFVRQLKYHWTTL
jgi:hypothetical protein